MNTLTIPELNKQVRIMMLPIIKHPEVSYRRVYKGILTQLTDKIKNRFSLKYLTIL